jgi:cytoskeletal protein CcmA (bactofilin family)
MARPQTSTAGSVLGESSSLRGRVSGEGDFEIRGRLEGEIDATGVVTLAETAIVKGPLRGGSVIVRGALVGDIVATEGITLEATARVVGNLRAPRIGIALGAQIRGDLDMGSIGEEPRKAPAQAARAVPARAPLPAARSVVVTRKAPVVVAAAVAAPPEPKKAPPPPVVPSIKKGTKAAPKRKGA